MVGSFVYYQKWQGSDVVYSHVSKTRVSLDGMRELIECGGEVDFLNDCSYRDSFYSHEVIGQDGEKYCCLTLGKVASDSSSGKLTEICANRPDAEDFDVRFVEPEFYEY
jgi:hypothetical protein